MKLNCMILAILMTLLSGGFASCSGNDTPENGNFSVNVEKILMLKDASSASFTVEAPAKPEITTEESSWLSVSDVRLNDGSSNVYTVTVNATANDSYDNRIGVLTVRCGSLIWHVTVTQANREGIAIDQSNATMASGGGELKLLVKATGDYSIETPDWMRASTTRSLEETTAVIIVNANFSGSTRQGVVTFTLKADPEQKAILEVTQESQEVGASRSAKEVARDIYAGWNLGNTLEAIGGETAWGNVKTSRELIAAVKSAGFNAVRIPCSWTQYLQADIWPYNIKAEWLARVKEVVDYVIDNGMYAIVNIHWDGGWLEQHANAASKDAVCKKQERMWTQIAEYFASYGDQLLFAGCNEVRDGDNWGMPDAGNREALEAYNQTFINAVRATGGNNAVRNLIVQSWCCNPWRALDSLTLPTDPATDHLMAEVHFYDPFYYSHSQSDPANVQTLWGYRPGYVSTNDQQEDYVDDIFGKLKQTFVDAGIPVILGEYGSVLHSITDSKIMDSQSYYLEYVTKAAKDNGIVPFVWDMGAMGIDNFAIINRKDQKVAYEHLLNGLMKGAAEGKYPF